MPIVSIEAPAGLAPGKKSKLMQQIDAALNDAYEIEDNMILLREYSRENVAVAGVLRSNATASRTPKSPRA